MRAILSALVSFLALLPIANFALSEEAGGQEIFASDWIEPSDASLKLIDAMFLGQVSALPKIRQDTLDKSLKHGDWTTMDTARRAAAQDFGVIAVFDWATTRHLAGYLGASSRYGLDLYSIGKATNRPDLVEASVGIWFYLYGVTLIDGHKCTDPSSPEVFMKKTMDAYADVRAFAATLSQPKLDLAVEYATMIEKLIAPDRASDPTICALGSKRLNHLVALNDSMNDMMSALKQREKEQAAGGDAITELPVHRPPSWIKPEQEWSAQAADARKELPGWLSELAAGLTGR